MVCMIEKSNVLWSKVLSLVNCTIWTPDRTLKLNQGRQIVTEKSTLYSILQILLDGKIVYDSEDVYELSIKCKTTDIFIILNDKLENIMKLSIAKLSMVSFNSLKCWYAPVAQYLKNRYHVLTWVI